MCVCVWMHYIYLTLLTIAIHTYLTYFPAPIILVPIYLSLHVSYLSLLLPPPPIVSSK